MILVYAPVRGMLTACRRACGVWALGRDALAGIVALASLAEHGVGCVDVGMSKRLD